jgi:hypothetical protein
MSDDEQLDNLIQDLAKEYHRPPEPPRAEMWARIQADRASKAARPAGRGHGLRWVGWAVGLAAVLVLGVAIGRFTAGSGTLSPVAVHADSIGAAGEAAPAAYRVATAEHMNHVETFLSVFTAEASAGQIDRADLELPARQLLRRTRLLQASPVADDVALRALLDDVEFVLLQISAYAQAGDAQDLRFAEQGINERSVLLRLRSALPSAPARAVAGGAL